MINKILVSLFLITFCNLGYACSIVLNPYILINNKAMSDNFISKSDCSDSINKDIQSKLKYLEGAVPAYSLSRNSDIVVTPKLIHVDHLSSLLKERLGLDDSHRLVLKSKLSNYFSQTKPLWDVSCKKCETSLGTQSIKLKSSNKTIWVSANLEKSVTGFRANKTINSMNKALIPSMFEKDTFFTSRPEAYITNVNDVVYYRTNKKIKQGSFVRAKDLTSKNLVTPNQKVQVEITGTTLNLKTYGKATTRGKLGDFITIKNLISKRTYIGKVVDFNKVVVEL